MLIWAPLLLFVPVYSSSKGQDKWPNYKRVSLYFQQRLAAPTALETPNNPINTPTQNTTASQIQNVLAAGDFQLASSDIANLGLSPLVYQWSAQQSGQGPLTAAVCAAGLTFTPGSVLFEYNALTIYTISYDEI